MAKASNTALPQADGVAPANWNNPAQPRADFVPLTPSPSFD